MAQNGTTLFGYLRGYFKGFLVSVLCGLSIQQGLSVTLAWDPNPETDIAGYILHYGTKSGQYTTAVNVGNVTTNTVSGLAVNVTYFFAVTAYNTSGLESDFSNEISYTVDATRPTVSITSPLLNARITNGTVVVQGTASDNKGVAQVLYQTGNSLYRVASGTTNWSVTLALVPGLNTITVKSVDTAGNESVPASVNITSVVVSRLTVATNGAGSISPNLNGQLLEIGKSYALLATPAAGNILANWTGGVATNTPQLTFVMQSNLVLIANFMDVLKPGVTITYPPANARLTNGSVTVQGRATDNKGVARVLVQLGNGPFQGTTGTTNWSATLALVPGPNTIRVKSVDAAGNESLAASETVTYVVWSPFTASTNGNGTIGPNLNGQLLEIAKSYTIQAVPGLGFVFTNWTGGIATNQALLTFAMQSNLTLVANFADVMKPTVSITSPVPNARLTNGTVTLQGHVTDNKAVVRVLYQLGNGPVQVATGTTNWSATLALVPGPNTVRVKSVDAAGNESLPVTEIITYVVWSPFTAGTNGNGSIVPNLNGQLLEIAKSYTIQAVPGLGFVFTNWTGGIATNKALLTFAMQSNLTLMANFVDVMKPTVSITSPVPNARLTNGTVTLQGHATDNKAVVQVLYQLGNGPFQVATGTTNWSATLALVPGPNTVRAKSVDAAGNESLPATEIITYVVWSPFTAGTNGNGSIVPNLNGQLLEIAKSYTIQAVPGLGFVFTNWTGDIATNKALLTFAMQSNLTLVANFVDVMKPTVSIASPLPNARLTNGTVTVQGHATDNKAVVRVLYQLGNDPFQVATGTTNWSATLALVPGPNTVRVKSVDAAGNESLPATEIITYVVWSPFTAGTNGNGSIVPNLNGQLLEIAKSYTIQAVPGLGFVFTNWTGGITTNSALLTFAMQSNLTLVANFVDVMKPTVSIASPLPNARLTNGTVTVQGHATDNKAVVRVLYQLGNDPFQAATGTTNWSATLALVPGPNIMRVKSMDAAGNESLVAIETITYVVLSPLVVQVTGTGSVVPNLNGKLLEVGEPYTMTAVAGSGFLFSNWVGGLTASTPVLPFRMQSNLVLTAQFVPNPFIAAAGNYNGLFCETNGVLHQSSGFFKLSLANGGAFSGYLITSGLTLPFSGQFDVGGRGQQTVARAGLTPLHLDLQFIPGKENEQIQGTISDGVWQADLLADHAWSNPTNHPHAGEYTLTMPGQSDPAAGPGGAGHGFVVVDAAGNLSLVGKLADGQSISQVAQISNGGEWPLYVSLYGGKGSILSWITFTNRGTDDLNGLLSWIKPGQPGSQYYPGGFANETMASGSIYTPPTTNRILNFTIGQVIFSEGNLSQPFTNSVTLDPLNRVINFSNNLLTFLINPANGSFSGTVRAPGSSVTQTFEGVLLPSANAGFGFFLGPTQSGQVWFEAAP